MNTPLNIEPTFQTLDALMRQSTEAALQSDKLADKCRIAAEKAVDEAISAAFSYGSPFRKMVEEAVKAALPIVRVDELNHFTHCVKTVVQTRLVHMADEVAKRQMDVVLEAILPDATVITMKEFHEAYIDKIREAHSVEDCDCYNAEDEPDHTWTIEKSKTIDTYWDLTISAKSNAGRYDSDTTVLRFNSGKEPGFHKCWHARAGNREELVNSLFVGVLHGFDAMLFRLYSGTTELQADI